MSNKGNGMSPHQRDAVLREAGFVPLRGGKGSHAEWEHPALRELAQQRKIAPPAFCERNEVPWQVTIPDNPKNGTWASIMKRVKWCQDTLAAQERGAAQDAAQAQRKQDSKLYDNWKRHTTLRLRAGLAPEKAPLTHAQILTLRFP